MINQNDPTAQEGASTAVAEAPDNVVAFERPADEVSDADAAEQAEEAAEVEAVLEELEEQMEEELAAEEAADASAPPVVQFLRNNTHGASEADEGYADVVFFGVLLNDGLNKEAAAAELKRLVLEHKSYEPEVRNESFFDGTVLDWFKVGAWLGDQGAGLALMGTGNLLGLWNLSTPFDVMGKDTPRQAAAAMADQGAIAISTAPFNKTQDAVVTSETKVEDKDL